MRKNNGDSVPEKTHHVVTTKERRRQEREQRRAEDQEWADRCGPVTVRKKESS